MTSTANTEMGTENNVMESMSSIAPILDVNQHNVEMERLHWMNHTDTIVNFQKSMKNDLQSCDITIAFKGRSVKAHRFVLSTCSIMLHELLKHVPIGEEATIIVPEAEGSLLDSILNFIYMGETNISSMRLPEFLDAIGNLGIKSPISFYYSENSVAKEEIIDKDEITQIEVADKLEEEFIDVDKEVVTIPDHVMSESDLIDDRAEESIPSPKPDVFFHIDSCRSLALTQDEKNNNDVGVEHLDVVSPMTEYLKGDPIGDIIDNPNPPRIKVELSDEDLTEGIKEPQTFRDKVDRLRLEQKKNLRKAVLAYLEGGMSLSNAAMKYNVSRSAIVRHLSDCQRSLGVETSSTADADAEEENQNTTANKIAIIRKRIRQYSNPFDLSDSNFLRYFRLSKEAFRYVLDEVIDKIPNANRSSTVSPILKLGTTLRILAEGSYRQVADSGLSLGLAQPTTSVIFNQFINILETEICPKWIQFNMTKEEKNQAKTYFYKQTGFPSVIGCVDSTNIRVLPPKRHQHLFVGNKGYCCLKAMIVCDHKMRIRYIDATYPGAAKDAHIWNRSQLKTILKDNFKSGDKYNFLLGDAAYPLEPYLITPFRDAVEGSPESKFNKIHAKSREIINRTIVDMKNRFCCLHCARQLYYEPQKAAKIINVCAALHNICIHYKVPITSDECNMIQNEYPLETDKEEIYEHNATKVALGIRTKIMNSLC